VHTVAARRSAAYLAGGQEKKVTMSRTVRHWLSLAAACAAWALPAPSALAQPIGDVPLAGHRAVYDLKLTQSRGKQSLESVRGRILYDFSGSVCEGYTLNFRQVTELDSGEGKHAVSDLRTTNWEDGAGNNFRFTTQNFIDNQPVDNSEGRAERVNGKLVVTLMKPGAKRVETEGAIFPSDHMRRIVIAAREGKSLLEVPTYDGAENGEKFYNSLTVIGAPIAPGQRAPTDAAAPHQVLSALTRWPVTISYFDRAKAGGDQTPAYAITFELYENGIARAVKLDYGDFVLDGELTTLEIKETKPCP
jgi:hypothetical protein